MEFIWRRRITGDLRNILLHAMMQHIIHEVGAENDENVDPMNIVKTRPIMTLILNFTYNHTVTNSTNTRTTSSFCKEFAEVIDGLEAEYLIASVMESSSIFSCALNSLRNFTALGERNGFIDLIKIISWMQRRL